MPTIRTSRDADGHWVAWLPDQPQNGFGGSSRVEAVLRLVETVGPDKVDYCPVCAGAGKYVGLQEVHVCGTCHGFGVKLQTGEPLPDSELPRTKSALYGLVNRWLADPEGEDTCEIPGIVMNVTGWDLGDIVTAERMRRLIADSGLPE